MQKIQVPGSKSISNRVLILAALSPSSTILKNLLISDDIRFLQNALTSFGVIFELQKNGDLKVTPPKILDGKNSENFIGNGGTPARLLVSLSTVMTGSFQLNGVDRMHERPFQDLFQAIQELGVKIQSEKLPNHLPAKFTNKKLVQDTTPTIKISGKISSQFISGLLLAASRMPQGLNLEIIDEIPSRPYVEMTIDIMKLWGNNIKISRDFKYFTVTPGLNNPTEFLVVADSSSASYPQAFALLKKTSVAITNFGAKTFQGDEKFLEISRAFGASIERRGDLVNITPPQQLQALNQVDFSTMPDVSMTGMILAAFAKGQTVFHGLESLRVKECDRIQAMVEGLTQLGVKISVSDDIVSIIGDVNFGEILQKNAENLNKLTINSYDDHRIAMVFGIIREIFNLEFKITDPHCVAKSWPDFWLALASWNQNLRPVSALILSKKSNNNDLKYLIVKKPRKNNAWQFPQGGRDAGETDKQAAIRELQEECGSTLNAKIKGEKPVGEYQYLFPEDFKRHDKNIKGAHVKFFKAEFINGEVELDHQEIIDYKWVTSAEFKNYFEDQYLTIINKIV
jgi:3-phosphoshikimate 1-carboxyvinyltransferase